MKLYLIYEVGFESHVTWGIATDLENVSKIKKDAVRSTIDRLRTYLKKEKIPYSKIKGIVNSIKVLEVEANDPTGGLYVVF